MELRNNIYYLPFRPNLAPQADIAGPGCVGAGLTVAGFMRVRFAWATRGGGFAWAGFAGAGFVRAGSTGGIAAGAAQKPS